MCHSNRLTRVACWLADYPEWLQFCWDFVKPPRNDEIALQHFFLACSSARIFFLFPLCCMQFLSSNKCLQEIFFQNHPSPPQELNGRPLISLSLRLGLITLTSTLINPDITKVSSNNSYRNTRESLGEREMLCCSFFEFSRTFTSVSITW